MSTMTRTQRLLVTRRNPDTTSYESIGEIARDDDGFTFTYRPGVTRPLPSMPLAPGPYVSSDLFPLFGHRVISPRRADHDDYLASLDLPPEATPFEVLARSGGRSAVDTLEITPMPEPGPVDVRFLVHGVRHLSEGEREHIATLRPGQALRLCPDPGNIADSRAVLVTDEGNRLGFVPRPLLEYVHVMLQDQHRLTLERLNPTESGYHMRLLVRLEGLLPQ